MLKNVTYSGTKCPACSDTKMVTDQTTGELFCGKCGFVVTEQITDTTPEWRSFSKEGGADPT